MNTPNNKLFETHTLNPTITLKNKIVMAPMTRRHAHEDHSPTEAMVNYYEKRSDAGLIISEGTIISQDAIGYGNVPGIYTKEHIKAWRKVTEKVHAKGGLMFLQLWHCGRVSHPYFHQGRLPISASATLMCTPLGNSGLCCGLSKEATFTEINNVIADYAHAAENAISAGFDGVELHGANGYLIDQFLHYCTNQRNDAYGSTVENMAKFFLEIISACASLIGIERIGIRISPGGHMAEINTDPRDKHVFSYLLSQLSALAIAYVHIGCFDYSVIYPELENKTMTNFVRTKFKGALITSGGHNYQSAFEGINKNHFDLVAFGRPFIANADLVKRIKTGVPLGNYTPAMLATLL